MQFTNDDGSVASNIKQATMGLKIIRANGAVEDLGVVAVYHKNPIKRLVHGVYVKVRTFFRIRKANKGVMQMQSNKE
jgi:hypothetical protein